MESESVIVLNFDYSYLNTVGWKKARKYIDKKKAEIVKAAKEVIRTVDRTYAKPVIVRLLEMTRSVYKKKVPFSFKNVLKRDKQVCQYCGDKATTIDHVYPKSKGGRNTFENCVAACKPCNHLKGNRMIYDTNLHLRKKPYAPTLIQFLQLRLELHGMADVLKEFWNKCNNI